MRPTGPLAGFSLLLAGLVACGGEPTRPQVPASVSVVPTTLSFTALGATQQITATVLDQDGRPISGLSTTFASGDLSVAAVTVGGVVRAVDVGATTVTASHGSLSVQVPVTVTQVVTQMAKVAGDQQAGLVGSELPVAVEVELRDANGNPAPGTSDSIQFAPGQGGSVADSVVAVGPDGRASTRWTLGNGAGSHVLTATLRQGSATAQFGANAVAAGAYRLEIRYVPGTSPTVSQQAAFNSAMTFWQSIIIGDLAPVAVNVPANACLMGQPALNETIDDMVVFVRFATLDGPGGTLAQAGRCDSDPPLRASSDSLPVLGVLELDSGDLPALEAAGTLDEVIIHELGHTLGFSRDFFALKSFLINPSMPGSPGVDTHFDGTGAIAQMNAVGGSGYGGAKVPLENTAVQGSADSHWRESVFNAELMTPVAELAGAMPFSVVSAAAMQDLGYTVNILAAQSFSLSVAAATLGPPRATIRLDNDVRFVRLPPPGAAAPTRR